MCLSHWHNVYVTSKTRKGKIEQGIHGWYKVSNICEDLLDLWWDSKWQVKVLWMRCDMICLCIVSNMEELVTCDKWLLTKEASKTKENETWVYAKITSQNGKLAYVIVLRIQIDKEDFLHDTNQHEFKMDG